MVDLQQVRSKGSRADSMIILEDFSDKLNNSYTSMILLLLAALSMVNVYVIRPISCNIEGMPKSDSATYAESICWMQGITNPNSNDGTQKVHLSFYQWVPFCFIAQAMLFYLPHLIWRTVSNCSFGDNLIYLVARARTAAVLNECAFRTKLVRACADQLYLLSRQHFSASTSIWSRFWECLCANQKCGRSCTLEKRMCNHSAVYYILIKVLYILNCIGQIFLPAYFLGQDASARNALMDFSGRLSNPEYGSGLFPHTGLCTFRSPGMETTVTCALPLNVLNEKMYLFLWVWILMVLTITVISTLTWIRRLLLRSQRNSFMRSFLYVSLLTPSSFHTSQAADFYVLVGSGAIQAATLDGALVERFLTEDVGCDGSFMLRMLKLNAGSIVTGEILVTWWRMFKANESAEDVEGEVIEFEPPNPQARTFAEMNDPEDPLDRMIRRTTSYI